MKSEKLLFATRVGTGNHIGFPGGPDSGKIMNGYCIPIAVSRGSGIESCWEELDDVQLLFDDLEIASTPGAGLWVYEVDVETGDDEHEDDKWLHLCGGSLRRPTIEEVTRLAAGEAPWDGGVML